MPRTKIVCTIGPASISPEVMRGLVRAGMDVARINFSHGDHATQAQSIATLRRVAEEEGRLVAVMADLQGPKLRVGEIEGGATELREGDVVTLTSRPRPGVAAEIPVPHPELLRDLRVDQTVLLDDGQLALVVVQAGERGPKCRVVTGGQLTSRTVFGEILAEADGIMVARGDLGVETPAEEVPFHQKHIICACNQAGKPVITATQMLQTMIENPRPTRAEASDVANAILDGTDAVMLSGETAVGRYPVVAAETMAVICANAEAHLPHGRLVRGGPHSHETITEAISTAAVEIAREVEASAIITATMSGTTARMVARHRPPVPILAVTPSRATLFRLALVWGVVPVQAGEFTATDAMVEVMVREARRQRLVARGDRVVLTAGIPFGSGRKTNLLKVHVVGEGEET